MTQGAHSGVPSCSVLRPVAFSARNVSRHRSGDDGIECNWARETPAGREHLRVHAIRMGAKLGVSAPEHARRTLAEEREEGGWADRNYSELHFGPDAYSHYERSGGTKNYTVTFRDSNLIVTVHHSSADFFIDPSELRRATMDFAAAIQKKIKRSPSGGPG